MTDDDRSPDAPDPSPDAVLSDSEPPARSGSGSGAGPHSHAHADSGSLSERLARARREVGDWLLSWRGTIRDGAVLHRLRSKWPPPWKKVAIAVAASLVVVWGAWETCGLKGCPNVAVLAAYQPGNAPVVLDREGNEITRLSPVRRELVSLEDLPEHVADAFVAVEDRRFYDHGGVDIRRVFGSLLANVRAGGVAQGGSTITMQLARNVFPDRLPASQRTLERKVLEVRVAREIEDHFSKDEILELYLNHIYFGGPVYGIETAAREYFGHGAEGLDLEEAAALAAMPKAPNRYDPRSNPEVARERRDLVLSLMEEQGRISGDEAERARGRSIRTSWGAPTPELQPPPAPYFVRAVRRLLEDHLGDALYAQPLRIRTTLDLDAQAAAERAMTRQLRSIERGAYGRFRAGTRYGDAGGVDSTGTRYLQGAVVVLAADSGDVLALVGGRDYDDSRFDRAMGARRQVGSAFKPFVYAAALENGYAPSQHLVDEPLEMELPGGEIWKPQNFGGGYRGEVTLREAAVESNNVATVRLAMAVGLDEVVEEARQAGIDGRLPMLPSLALGTAGLTLLELVSSYTALATLGTAVAPRLVRSVEDTTGAVVWESDVERNESLDQGVAYLTTDLLRDAVDSGTGSAVRRVGYRGAAAGKTGTTDQGHDAWFVGYTPDVVTGVWIGFDHPAPITDRATGGRLAAPVWGRIMAELGSKAGSGSEWERPESVVERSVDPASGLVLAEGCTPVDGEGRVELFLEDHVPAETCPEGAEEGPGFFTRIARGVKSAFRSVGGFIAGIFSGDDDEEAAERERYLGKPRLPQARETVRVEEPDTSTIEPPSGPIGVPLDSLPEGWGDVPVPSSGGGAADSPPESDTVPPADPDRGSGGPGERESGGPPEGAGPPPGAGPPGGPPGQNRPPPDTGGGG